MFREKILLFVLFHLALGLGACKKRIERPTLVARKTVGGESVPADTKPADTKPKDSDAPKSDPEKNPQENSDPDENTGTGGNPGSENPGGNEEPAEPGSGNEDPDPAVDPKPEPKPEVPIDQVVADAKIGEEIFLVRCSGCHAKGQRGTAGNTEKDLNTTVPEKRPHSQIYPNRRDWLSPVDAKHVGAYLTKK